MHRHLSVTLAVVALTLASVAQQPKVLAPRRPIAPRLPDSAPKTGPLRSMVGGLWMIDANFKSTIYIKNSVEIAPVTVTPILYLSNGKKVTLKELTLEASGTATISVNDGLNENGISPWATLNGYVEIQYKWPWDPLCVTVTSVDTVHSVIFTNGLRPLDPMNPSARAILAKGPGPQIVEGMWWKQEPQVTGFVALSNTTERVMKAQLQINDSTGQSIGEHTFTVSPHGTKTVHLRELQSVAGSSGGLRVTYNGTATDLLPNGGLEDEASGYSATVPFVLSQASHTKGSTQSYAELGLMTGAADPMMQFPAGTTFTPYSLLRNISEQAASATPSIYWMEAGTARSAPLPAIKLLPYQTQNLDVPALLSLAGLKNFNGSFNLVFDVEGSVLMASGSVDQKNTYVFEVMPASVKESASKSIGNWSTNNGDDTMVTLWNPADEAQDLLFTLNFPGGHYCLPIHLDPRATRMFNVSEIIQNQIPDKDGNVIPANVHEGNAAISGVHAENEHILVAVEAGIYNVRKATCAYTCNNCNGMVSSSLAILGFGVPIGGNVQMSLKDTWNTGVQHDWTNGATWTSNHTSIATVTTTGTARGKVTGVSYGEVIIDGAFASEPWAGQQCGSPPQACPPDEGFADSGGGGVGAPQIKQIQPPIGAAGTAPTVAITGSNFGSAQGNLTTSAGSQIGVNILSWSDGAISATFNIGTNAPPQNYTVVVTTAAGAPCSGCQGQGLFYVTAECNPTVSTGSYTIACNGTTKNTALLLIGGADEPNVTDTSLTATSSDVLTVDLQGTPYTYTTFCATGNKCYGQDYIGYTNTQSKTANINWSVQIYCSNSPYPSQTVSKTSTVTCQ